MNAPLCPPPRRFKPADNVERVELMLVPPFEQAKRGRTQSQTNGLRHERAGAREFFRRFDGQYVHGPWLQFQESMQAPRCCQPDGWIVDFLTGFITIVEFKLQHTAQAWWQVRRLYQPVTAKLFGPDWRIKVLEVVRWFDPATQFPEPVVICSDPARVPEDRFGVFVLR